MNNELKVPPLPTPRWKVADFEHFARVYTESEMLNYARDAVREEHATNKKLLQLLQDITARFDLNEQLTDRIFEALGEREKPAA